MIQTLLLALSACTIANHGGGLGLELTILLKMSINSPTQKFLEYSAKHTLTTNSAEDSITTKPE